MSVLMPVRKSKDSDLARKDLDLSRRDRLIAEVERIAELERTIASSPPRPRARPWGPSPASPPDFRPFVAYAAAGIGPTPAE